MEFLKMMLALLFFVSLFITLASVVNFLNVYRDEDAEENFWQESISVSVLWSLFYYFSNML